MHPRRQQHSSEQDVLAGLLTFLAITWLEMGACGSAATKKSCSQVTWTVQNFANHVYYMPLAQIRSTDDDLLDGENEEKVSATASDQGSVPEVPKVKSQRQLELDS
jgi:hypothetical protein